MDIKDLITILLSVAFVVTGLRAILHKRYILATSLLLLLGIPLGRYHIIPLVVAQVMNNIGAFGILYKINWFLENLKERPDKHWYS